MKKSDNRRGTGRTKRMLSLVLDRIDTTPICARSGFAGILVIGYSMDFCLSFLRPNLVKLAEARGGTVDRLTTGSGGMSVEWLNGKKVQIHFKSRASRPNELKYAGWPVFWDHYRGSL